MLLRRTLTAAATAGALVLGGFALTAPLAFAADLTGPDTAACAQATALVAADATAAQHADDAVASVRSALVAYDAAVAQLALAQTGGVASVIATAQGVLSGATQTLTALAGGVTPELARTDVLPRLIAAAAAAHTKLTTDTAAKVAACTAPTTTPTPTPDPTPTPVVPTVVPCACVTVIHTSDGTRYTVRDRSTGKTVTSRSQLPVGAASTGS